MKTLETTSRKRAVALVITLSLVALVSAILVAFVTRARLDMSATRSYVATPQAEALAMGALDTILFELKREMETGSEQPVRSFNGPDGEKAFSYRPRQNADANLLIQPMDGLDGFVSLVKVSRENSPLFKGDRGWDFGGGQGFSGASGISTSERSLNGRSFGDRWNAPYLMTAEDCEELDRVEKADPLPHWVYVGRTGVVHFTREAPVTDEHRNRGVNNEGLVLGRYAFMIYDLSGLLDANVIGRPDNLDPGTQSPSKESLAWADLDAFRSSVGLGQSYLDGGKLFEWRAQGKGFTNWVAHAGSNGFIRAEEGENRFLGRGDLVKAAFPQQERGASETVGLTTNALPYLTLFSLEKNAPSWWPRTPTGSSIDYETESLKEPGSAVGVTNRFVCDVRVTKSYTVGEGGDDEVRYREGDALVKRRFPLKRLGLFEEAEKGNSAAVQKIERYFGLIPMSTEAGNLTRDPRSGGRITWVYRGDEGNGGRNEIKLLGKIAETEEREPDFFELLQAAVLYGSVGKVGLKINTNGQSESNCLSRKRDASFYHQILQIGANIIDQYDEDDIPTMIYSFSRFAQVGQGDALYPRAFINELFTVTGIESIPYLSHIGFTAFRDWTANDKINVPDFPSVNNLQITGGDPGEAATVLAKMADPKGGENKYWPRVKMYMQFQLWNPHFLDQNTGFPAKEGRYRISIEDGYTSVWPPRGNNRGPDYHITAGFSTTQMDLKSSAARYTNMAHQSYAQDLRTYEQILQDWVSGNSSKFETRDFAAAPMRLTFTVAPENEYASFKEPMLLLRRMGSAQIGRALNLEAPPDARDEMNRGININLLGAYLGSCLIPCNLEREDLGDRWWFDPTNPTLLPQPVNASAGRPPDGPDFWQVYDRLYRNYSSIAPYPAQYGTAARRAALDLLEDARENDYTKFTWIDKSIGNAGNDDPQVTAVMQAPVMVRIEKEVKPGQWMTYQVYVPTRRATGSASVGGVSKFYLAGSSVGEYRNAWTGTCGATFRDRGTLNRPVNNEFVFFCDPRTQRFGLAHSGTESRHSSGIQSNYKWPMRTIRDTARFKNQPDWGWTNWFWGWGNYILVDGQGEDIELDSSLYAQYSNDGIWRWTSAIAELAENFEKTSKMWSRDKDRLVRRGDSWRQMGGKDSDYNVYNYQAQARPRRLDRAFHSVAEMGYAMRGDPWKTLSFAYTASGDAGLLDFFCLDESPGLEVRGGTINPNSASEAVLRSLLSGTYLNALTNKTEDGNRILTIPAEDLARRIRTYLGERTKPDRVLRNVADIAEMTSAICTNNTLGDIEPYKWRQEAIARSLADVCNTRTWNLLVDVVAQAGGFSPESKTARDFQVHSERRLWMQVALDRFTGEVVGMEIERVLE